MPDLENYRAEVAPAPTDGTKLLRIVVLLVDDIYLIEYLLRLIQADTVFSLDVLALPPIELEPHRRI